MRRRIDLALATGAAASLAAVAAWIGAGIPTRQDAGAERVAAPFVTTATAPEAAEAAAAPRAEAPRIPNVAATAPRRPASPPAAARPAGMLVAIDPETGALVAPTPEQRARLIGDVAITGNPAAGLLEERAADGTVTLHLDERFAQYSVVRAGAAGAPTHQCVDGREAADAAVRAPGVPARAAEEE